jgi:uncharacterized membrane protein YgcG
MQPRRTITHGPQGGWSAIAVHLEPAEPGKEGFYLALIPDARAPVVVFLNCQQVSTLLEMALTQSVSDQAIWEVVARIPLEPLLPSRSLHPRLRSLLVDFAGPIREQIRAQADRPRPAPAPLPEDPAAVDAASGSGLDNSSRNPSGGGFGGSGGGFSGGSGGGASGGGGGFSGGGGLPG